MKLGTVKEAIVRGRPLIAGFGERHETAPLGGHGLTARGQAGPMSREDAKNGIEAAKDREAPRRS